MIELNIFDLDFNRVGEVSEYESLRVERNYGQFSELTLLIDGKRIKDLINGRILTTVDNPQLGYMILLADYVDERGSLLEVTAYSLNFLLNRRIIDTQQRFEGNVEDVIKSFVEVNAINPTNPNRIIPNLRLAPNSGINETTEETTFGDKLDEYIYGICKRFELSFDVLMNHDDKKFDFVTWKGIDRSAQQSVNPHVIFSKEFDNVIRQNYVKSDFDKRSTAIVTGEGDDSNQKRITVNNDISGFDRIELHVNASDVQQDYLNEKNQNVTLTNEEYETALHNRGLSVLADHTTIETFESEVDMYSQFIYGRDYSLGDIVSVKNEEINKILHARISSAVLKSDRKGTELDVKFGSNIPTLLEKIKKAVK